MPSTSRQSIIKSRISQQSRKSRQSRISRKSRQSRKSRKSRISQQSRQSQQSRISRQSRKINYDSDKSFKLSSSNNLKPFNGGNLIVKEDYPYLLTSDLEKRVYHNIQSVFNLTNSHWGQLKLFYSEVIFLNLCMKKYDLNDCVCVYAGAAPGHHNFILRMMYPTLRWILVDPAPFVTKEDSHISIYNEYFTNDFIDSVVKKHKFVLRTDIKNDNNTSPRHILFISDIRLGLDKDDTISERTYFKQWERAILRDNIMQQEWAMLLGAKYIMYKFHMPMFDALEAESSAKVETMSEQIISEDIDKSESIYNNTLTPMTSVNKDTPSLQSSISADVLSQMNNTSLQNGGAPSGLHYLYDTSSIRDYVSNPEIFDDNEINYNRQFVYMDGVIFKQLYSPRHSTETRLICQCDDDGKYKMRAYDADRYTRQLYYFNLYERMGDYVYKRSQALKYNIAGLDDGYSSVAEYYVIDQYLTLINELSNANKPDSEKVTQYTQSLEVIKMIYMIHKNITKITGKSIMVCATIDIIKHLHKLIKKYTKKERGDIIKYLSKQFSSLWVSINKQIKFFEVPREIILDDKEYSDQIKELKRSNNEINRMKITIFKKLSGA